MIDQVEKTKLSIGTFGMGNVGERSGEFFYGHGRSSDLIVSRAKVRKICITNNFK